MSATQALRNRILDRCCPEPNTGCWLWLGCTVGNGSGYGVISVLNKSVRAHRASYLAFVGEIAEGLCVCHRCDTQACVNPEHMFLGTQLENVHDMFTKKRAAHGERCGQARLTAADVAQIRADYARGGVSNRDLALRYGVGKATVSAVTRGSSWVGAALRAAKK